MIDDATKRSILDEILTSDGFKSSSINKKLLTYLVEVSIKNELPNEYTIASEVFCKSAGFNPNEDTIVRVSIHNLRKKLETFYKKEGKKAKIKIEIPKGHYEVIFIKKAKKRVKKLLLSSNFLLLLIISILIIFIMLSQLRILSLKRYVGESIEIANHPIWKDILTKERPKSIVLGDNFFFLEDVDYKEMIVRKHDINSRQELEQFKRQYSDKIIKKKTPYPFIPLTSITPLPQVFPLFRSELKISFQYSSNLKSVELLKSDIIFFGSFRNLYILNQALKDIISSLQLGAGTNILQLNLPDSIVTLTLDGDPATEHSDYCLVRKVPGPNKNTMILFTSFFIAGITGATNYMTNPETLAEIEQIFKEKYGTSPQYFDILFKTTGYSRTAFTTQIEYINKIDPDISIW